MHKTTQEKYRVCTSKVDRAAGLYLAGRVSSPLVVQSSGETSNAQVIVLV